MSSEKLCALAAQRSDAVMLSNPINAAAPATTNNTLNIFCIMSGLPTGQGLIWREHSYRKRGARPAPPFRQPPAARSTKVGANAAIGRRWLLAVPTRLGQNDEEPVGPRRGA